MTTFYLSSSAGSIFGATRTLLTTNSSSDLASRFFGEFGSTIQVYATLHVVNSSGVSQQSWTNTHAAVDITGLGAYYFDPVIVVGSDYEIPSGGGIALVSGVVGTSYFDTSHYAQVNGTLKAGSYTPLLPFETDTEGYGDLTRYWGSTSSTVEITIEASSQLTFSGVMASESDDALAGTMSMTIHGSIADESDTTFEGQFDRTFFGDVAADVDSSLDGLSFATGILVGGSAGNYYPQYAIADTVFEHDPTNHYACVLMVRSGSSGGSASSYNLKYDSYSVSGNSTILEKQVDTDLTLTTTITERRPGVFLVDMAFTAGATTKRIYMNQNLSGDTTRASEAHFHANMVTKSPYAAMLIPGDGYTNEWFTTPLSKSSTVVNLVYGNQTSEANDYGFHVEAGTSRSMTFCISVMRTPADTNAFRKAAVTSYHDAFSPTGHAEEMKVIWSSSHQLLRHKRHIHSEPRYIWPIPSERYTTNIYPWDSSAIVLGMNDEYIMDEWIRTAKSFGGTPPVEGGYASRTVAMDGTRPYNDLMLFAYAHKYLNREILPDETALALSSINNMISNNHQMLFDPSFEPQGFAPSTGLSYAYLDGTMGWITHSGSATRVTTDGGVSPQSGSYQAKLTSGTTIGSHPTFVEPSVSLSLSLMVNIPTPLSDGIRIGVLERDASKNTVATTYSSKTTTTSGWQQITFNHQVSSSTRSVIFIIDNQGGLSYVDNAVMRRTTPVSDMEYWGFNAAPDYAFTSSEATTEGSDVCAAVWAAAIVYKYILTQSGQWTQQMEDFKEAARSAFRTRFYHDGLVRYDLHNPDREGWMGSDCFVMWAYTAAPILNEKLLTDEEMLLVYSTWPSTSIETPFGNNAFPGMLIREDGDFVSPLLSGFGGSSPGGQYQNGGAWLRNCSAIHILASRAGHPNAIDNLRNRILIETYREYASHECINTAGDYEGAGLGVGEDPSRMGYGWNAYSLMREIPALTGELNANGKPVLYWEEYKWSNFLKYELRRYDTSYETPQERTYDSGVLVRESYSIEDITYTDTSASEAETYVYALFSHSDDGEILKSVEFLVTIPFIGMVAKEDDIAISHETPWGTGEWGGEYPFGNYPLLFTYAGDVATEPESAPDGVGITYLAGSTSYESDESFAYAGVFQSASGVLSDEYDSAQTGTGFAWIAPYDGSLSSESDFSPNGTSYGWIRSAGSVASDIDTASDGVPFAPFIGLLTSDADLALNGSVSIHQYLAGSLATESDKMRLAWGDGATWDDGSLWDSQRAIWSLTGLLSGETDTAIDYASTGSGVIGLLSDETDTALDGSFSLAFSGALATEADDAIMGSVPAQPITFVGMLASEDDTALDGVAKPSLLFAGSLSSESDDSLVGSSLEVFSASQSDEVDTAIDGVGSHSTLTSVAEEVDSAFDGVLIFGVEASLALEIEDALSGFSDMLVGSVASDYDMALDGATAAASWQKNKPQSGSWSTTKPREVGWTNATTGAEIDW